jgi:hypothetical protein
LCKGPRLGETLPRSAFLIFILLFCFFDTASWASTPADKQTVIVVVGAEGTPEYGQQFREWANRWSETTKRAEATFIKIGDETSSPEDRDRLRETLAAEQTGSGDTLWLVLIGHGTFDGRNAKFNLRGTDVSATELADWLRPHTRPMVIVNCASGSGPFINALSAPQRVIITATKSGQEQNFARFGDYFSLSIAAPEADLDKDGQTSVLEVYLSAAHRVAEFYEQESRLATEHPLLDDTGDALGTPSDWFQGVRAVKRAQNAQEVDGRRARQWALVRSEVERGLTPEIRSKRDALELELEHLRDLKPKLEDTDYYQRLEKLLLQLAELYRE